MDDLYWVTLLLAFVAITANGLPATITVISNIVKEARRHRRR